MTRDPKVQSLIASVTGKAGVLSPETRQALLEGGKLPAALAAYAKKVRTASGRVQAGDMAALKDAGLSEDAVFEATVAAALGEGLARLDKGRSLLKGGKP